MIIRLLQKSKPLNTETQQITTTKLTMKILSIYYLFTNLLCFGVYAWDKFGAMRGRRRVAEIRLHFLAAISGGLGALLGQVLLRHKTQKFTFTLTAYLSLIMHLCLIAYLVSIT